MLFLATHGAGAQEGGLGRTAVTLSSLPATSVNLRDTAASPFRRQIDRIPRNFAPLASLLMPGLGQARLGKDRFVAYLAAEAFLLLEYSKNGDEGRSNEASLRAIARDVARRNFPGTHPDSVWSYYEKMETYLESGSFSRATSGTTVPEIDPATYNGQQWILARQVYGVTLNDPNPVGTPGYDSALAYYETRAIPLAYGWSWDNAQLEKDLFVRAIKRRNDAYRRATGDLIGLIANHLISGVDALSILRIAPNAGSGINVSAAIPIR